MPTLRASARREVGAGQGGIAMFRTPMINLYTMDIQRSLAFYQGLGFVETFRTPQDGPPVHVEVTLDGFTIGIATAEAASAEHGLRPQLNGRAIEIVLWTDDTDRAFARLTAGGAHILSRPHDFLDNLRAAWVADPDDNPIQLVQRRS
jgi:catechol 2,3-dioxygenase-like lactoylglutathione lyase family enzyme